MSVTCTKCRLFAASAVAFSILFFTGCSLFPKEEEPLKPPLIQPDQQNTYVTADVQRGNLLKKIDAIGALDPNSVEYYEVSEPGSRLHEIKVKPGDVVKKGDLLLQLNDDGLELELKREQLVLAQKRLAYDDAKSSEDERHLEVRGMEIDIAQLQVNESQKKLDNSRLLAKKDGIVTYVTNLKPGEPVSEFQPLAATADPNDVKIAITLNDSDALKEVKLGMEAELMYNGKTYRGKVVQTPANAPTSSDAKSAEQDSKTIYIQAMDPLEKPQIGQQVNVTIRLASKENVLYVPLRAIRSNDNMKVVQVLNGNQLLELAVTTGMETAEDVEITDGLKEGQKVVLP